MLIVAPVATWARRLASQDAGVEGGQLWLDHRRTVAVLLGEAVPGTEPGILMKEHARD
jgi:hypothetical protein